MRNNTNSPITSLAFFFLFAIGFPALDSIPARAQQAPAAPPPAAAGAAANPAAAQDSAQGSDPLKRPISEKEKRERAKSFKHEVSQTYKKWLDQDVRWIITDDEKQTFMQLSNDEERDNFIEQFWQRRNPNPDSEVNEYKEEHYRRIAYANEHYAAGKPGWMTDRGRMYIMYGPADEVDTHPNGGTYNRPQEEGGGTTETYPYEDWRYRYIEGVGQNVEIEFVDPCMCGEYHMTLDRCEKDALAHTSGGGQTTYEQQGLATQAQRLQGNGVETCGPSPLSATLQTKEWDRLRTFANLEKAPVIKFKDLEEVVSSKITFNLLPFDVRADFVKVTAGTVLVPVTIQIQNKDVTFVKKDDVQLATVNIFGRVTTLTGRIAQTFEDTVQINAPADLFDKTVAQSSIYWKSLPLKPGLYRLDLVLKDVNGDRKGTWSKGIRVPEYSDEKLSASTLILADVMEKVPTRQVGAGNFVIGDTKVRPRVAPSDGRPPSFKRDQSANVWMQVYNLGVDEKTHKPDATIEYDIVNKTAPDKPVTVLQRTEDTAQLGTVGDQLTIEKSVPLNRLNLTPGTYELDIKVYDRVAKQSLTPAPTARFVVE